MKLVRKSLATVVLALTISTTAHASVVWGTVVSRTGSILSPVFITLSLIVSTLP